MVITKSSTELLQWLEKISFNIFQYKSQHKDLHLISIFISIHTHILALALLSSSHTHTRTQHNTFTCCWEDPNINTDPSLITTRPIDFVYCCCVRFSPCPIHFRKREPIKALGCTIRHSGFWSFLVVRRFKRSSGRRSDKFSNPILRTQYFHHLRIFQFQFNSFRFFRHGKIKVIS